MASLNLSINGASIKSSYNGVVNAPAPSSSSPTHAQWALFSVQAPLMSAFQDAGSKESVLKVQDTGDGELADLIEDFNEGRIQFAFVKVKDPNSGLPKNVLIAWCGGGVPERTKGYFTSHLNAVGKVLHGYHVQITARSDGDLEPDSIMRKVADASGAKYAGDSSAASTSAPPPIRSKPVFTPTTSSAATSTLASRAKKDQYVDADGWGADAPPVTRTQLEKVESAYKPTKVDINALTAQKQEPSRFVPQARHEQDGEDVVKGGYQPVGKVDIAAIRAASKNKGDERPEIVKGAYEPVGKVDIAAIRAKSQKPTPESSSSERPAPVADRASAFTPPSGNERLTSLPKPKVANKFGGASSFTGTKAPAPGGLGFGGPATPSAAPVGAASRTFADEGGKTPAQLWAEKKAKEKGTGGVATPSPSTPAPLQQDKSGSEWKSGYAGKSWAPVQTSSFGGLAKGEVQGDEEDDQQPAGGDDEAGGVSALRDRFKNTAPIGAGTPPASRALPDEDEQAPPPPPPASSRPGAPGGFALPGLPSRPPPPTDEEEQEEEDPSAYQPASPERESSPARVAIPVARGPDPTELKRDEPALPPPMPVSAIPIPKDDELPDEAEAEQVARGASEAVAAQTFEPEQVDAGRGAQAGLRAVAQYDYDKAEDNEIDLVDGQIVTNIEMVDEDWWMGTNHKGQSGLFPSNYVELVEGDESSSAPPPPPAPAAAPTPAAPTPAAAVPPPPAPAASGKPTATALYDYEAAEPNELSFPEDAKVTDLEFPDEDWWFGHYKGDSGLFPANYVQLDQ